jgi:hypothetical protein
MTEGDRGSGLEAKRGQVYNVSILKMSEKALGSALDTGQLTSAGAGVRSQHFKNIFNPLGRI